MRALLLPIKDLRHAKQRLAPLLNPEERFGLAQGRVENPAERVSTNAAATITPHTATASGLARVTRNEASSAGTRPTSRSSISGNETTLIASASAAKQKPTSTPTTINVHPRPVVRTS